MPGTIPGDTSVNKVDKSLLSWSFYSGGKRPVISKLVCKIDNAR